MNATSLYIKTCRLVMKADPDNKDSWSDLYNLLPFLRQSLSCTVCGKLLTEPHSPTESNCQHHVCQKCLGEKKKLKPTCSWCKDYKTYIQNVQIKTILKCYKKLCEYVKFTSIYYNLSSVFNNGGQVNLVEVIDEAIAYGVEVNNHNYILQSDSSVQTSPRVCESKNPLNIVDVEIKECNDSSGSENDTDNFSTSQSPLNDIENSPESVISLKPEISSNSPLYSSFSNDFYPETSVYTYSPNSSTNTVPVSNNYINTIPVRTDSLSTSSNCIGINTVPISTTIPINTTFNSNDILSTNCESITTDFPKYLTEFPTKDLPTINEFNRLLHANSIVTSNAIINSSSICNNSIANDIPLTLTASTNSSCLSQISKANTSSIISSIISKPITLSAPTPVVSVSDVGPLLSSSSLLPPIICQMPTSGSREHNRLPLPTASSGRPTEMVQQTMFPQYTTEATSVTNSVSHSLPPGTIFASTNIKQNIKEKPFPKQTHANNTSSIYSVMYTDGDSTKITIKRKPPDSENVAISKHSIENDIKPIMTPELIKKPKPKPKPKPKGCRCGNATPTPGKLTCCGQRCPCYVEAKACIECRCRGCRNPHRPGGKKVRPVIPQLGNIQIHQVQPVHGRNQNFVPSNTLVSNMNSPLSVQNVLPINTITTMPQTIRAVQAMHAVQAVHGLGHIQTVPGGMHQIINLSPTMMETSLGQSLSVHPVASIAMKPVSLALTSVPTQLLVNDDKSTSNSGSDNSDVDIEC